MVCKQCFFHSKDLCQCEKIDIFATLGSIEIYAQSYTIHPVRVYQHWRMCVPSLFIAHTLTGPYACIRTQIQSQTEKSCQWFLCMSVCDFVYRCENALNGNDSIHFSIRQFKSIARLLSRKKKHLKNCMEWNFCVRKREYLLNCKCV